jgi:hypothetical protein
VTLVKLPIALQPMMPNAVISGVKLHGEHAPGTPLVKMFDNEGYQLLPDENSILHRGNQALPDILKILDIIEDPKIDYYSREHQLNLLNTTPKSFVGRSVYQYWPDADPPGVYEGTIISHCRDLDTDELWEVSWPALSNNNAMQTTYNADDMILNCIDGDPSAAVTESNLQQQIDKHIDTLQSLDDFQLYITKHNDTMAKVFGATVPPCDRHLYLAWIWKLFGYGQHASDHPDSLRFPDPYPSGPDGKLHLIKFKKGTRFPIPSGDAWLQMKQQKMSAASLRNRRRP